MNSDVTNIQLGCDNPMTKVATMLDSWRHDKERRECEADVRGDTVCM